MATAYHKFFYDGAAAVSVIVVDFWTKSVEVFGVVNLKSMAWVLLAPVGHDDDAVILVLVDGSFIYAEPVVVETSSI